MSGRGSQFWWWYWAVPVAVAVVLFAGFVLVFGLVMRAIFGQG